VGTTQFWQRNQYPIANIQEVSSGGQEKLKRGIAKAPKTEKKVLLRGLLCGFEMGYRGFGMLGCFGSMAQVAVSDRFLELGCAGFQMLFL